MKTWGEIYHKWLRKGYDHGYAAWLADRYIQRMKRRKRHPETVSSQDANESRLISRQLGADCLTGKGKS